ncbi:YciI family protein [Demequina gelatinilytica]|uniref:YciI family protein n=1 Tax=Demequina gelatinilytica TaxID=1638980 RepID=UPI000782C794|nr:YciI family protein [Demequina gelatinilytica]
MPRYHLAMYYEQESGEFPDDLPQIIAEMERFEEELRERGILVTSAGFSPSTEARVVVSGPDGGETSEGTYLPGPVQSGGFWLIDAPNMGDAIVWAERFSRVLRLPVEVREVRL